MATIVNEPSKGGRLISKVRGMYEHRATWLYLLLVEARKKGLAWKDFAPDAIYRCGLFHGAAFGGRPGRPAGSGGVTAAAAGAPLKPSLIGLRKKGFNGLGKRVFEMRILKSTEDELDVEFHYCPLVSAWKKQGATDEEIAELCDIAMRGDAGIAEAFGARLELPQVIAKGAPTCRVRFVR
jgi:hypothetical protein